MVKFTHFTGDRVHMVDISEKVEVYREAVSEGRIFLREETLRAIQEGSVEKGNVLATARVAATLAVKQTPLLIPLCHQIPLTAVDVDFEFGEGCLRAEVRVRSHGKTGVEMEALTGVSVALLTVWDMVKSAEKDAQGQYPFTRIEGIRVVEKWKGT
ncbi:MAG: cyclic pyranopterin monophosphate synthase MoaC [Methanomicrobiales archaeon]|nr:cyclic pyranopterin monophosphate synthase MoaC [Methanomicrobiales archaeon]